MNPPSNVNPNIGSINSTDNLNTGFMNLSAKNQTNIDINDFSTMQLLFQSNSGINSLNGFQQQQQFSANTQQQFFQRNNFLVNQHIDLENKNTFEDFMNILIKTMEGKQIRVTELLLNYQNHYEHHNYRPH